MNTPQKWTSLGAAIVATLALVLGLEGGYVNDPNDSGGATNHGITEQVARAHGYSGAMQALPQTLAQDIYTQSYILQPRFDQIIAQSPAVGTKLVDAGVNAGPGRSARWLQQSLNDLSRAGRDYQPIAVDGVVGSQTLAAYKMLEQKRGHIKACELTIKAFEGYQTSHYTALAKGQKNASFVVGWLDHRIGNVPLSRCAERILSPPSPPNSPPPPSI